MNTWLTERMGNLSTKLLFAFQEELCFMGGVGAKPRNETGTNILRMCLLFILNLCIKRSKTGFLFLENKGIFTLFRRTEIFQNPFLVTLHHYAYVLYTQYSNTSVLV
jgi:hypothetical protein